MSIAGGVPFMKYFDTKEKKVIYAQFELTNGEVQAAQDWANMWEELIESGSVKVKEG